MASYLNELNETQRQAVECTEGPLMIVAGAGSGKTRVLTYRIVHLLNKNVDAFNILALTFTNKAAREMKERITSILGNAESKNLWMGTFHSVFARILRAEANKINYPQNFTIYDTEDSKSLIKDILKELNIDDKIYKPNLVYGRISAAKNNLVSAQAYNQNSQISDEDKMSGRPLMGQIYEIYAKRCFRSGAMDFDDLLFNTNVLLRDFPEVLLKYQDRFKYIMVDEYQDTNFSQYIIIKQLAARFENICVVGDDAQSIYAFRGANIQNILNFEKDYPDLKIFKLEQNYRSTQTIVNAANSIILNNKDQLKKTVWTDNEEGEKIKVLKTLTDNEEGVQVANSIFETKMRHQARNKDFAILYRTNAQSRAMEEALRRLNIPYKIYGGLSFYQRKEIKDLLAYFRLTINNHDEESLKRVINYPARGIGDTTLQKLILAATDHDVSIWTVIENLNEFNVDLNTGTKNKIIDFATLIKGFSAMQTSQNAYDLGNYIANNSGILREFYTDKTPEGVSRYENIQELLNGLKEFSENTEIENAIENIEQEALGQNSENTNNELFSIPKQVSLSEFMKDIALLTDTDKTDEKEEKDTVSLMTIHAAKGLEFPYVNIVGMEENLFPSQMTLNSRADLEEERRLFYVALTRAEKGVTLSYAQTRYRWGNLISCEVSRFVEEINPQYITMPTGSRIVEENIIYRESSNKTTKKVFTPRPSINQKLVKASAAKASDYNPEALRNLQVGMVVMHEKFGTGKVTTMEGIFPNNKATVFFESVGQKQLLLKFARLKILT